MQSEDHQGWETPGLTRWTPGLYGADGPQEVAPPGGDPASQTSPGEYLTWEVAVLVELLLCCGQPVPRVTVIDVGHTWLMLTSAVCPLG